MVSSFCLLYIHYLFGVKEEEFYFVFPIFPKNSDFEKNLKYCGNWTGIYFLGLEKPRTKFPNTFQIHWAEPPISLLLLLFYPIFRFEGNKMDVTILIFFFNTTTKQATKNKKKSRKISQLQLNRSRISLETTKNSRGRKEVQSFGRESMLFNENKSICSLGCISENKGNINIVKRKDQAKNIH